MNSILAHLNFDHPGLEAAGSAYREGRIADAEALVLDYFRHRTEPAWYGRMEPLTDLEPARRAMERRFTIVNSEIQLAEPMDWAADPIGDPEWTWQLGRHAYFEPLLRAYLTTGDEAYAADLDKIIHSWCVSCPMPDGVVRGEKHWRTIEAGIRMHGWWVPCWIYLQKSPSLRTETRLLMLKTFYEHGWFLFTHHRATGNWLLMEMNGLAHIGTYFPEFREAPAWRALAKELLEKEIQVQILPDGGQIELTTHYHFVCIRNFLHPQALPGWEQSPEYLARVHVMFDWLDALQRPDHTLPQLQDTTFHTMPVSTITEQYLKWQWLDGVPAEFLPRVLEMPPVPQESAALVDSGYYIMRAPNLYLLVDAGPFGYAHHHEDKLSVDVWGCGSPLILDPGINTYTPEKAHYWHSAGHSTVLVDGLGQNRLGAFNWTAPPPEKWYRAELNPPVRWKSTPEYDLVDAMYDEGYGADMDRSVTHRRRILFVKPFYWLVVDDMLPGTGSSRGREHTYEQLWHLRPGPAALDAEAGEAWTLGADGNLLVVSDRLRDLRLISGGLGPRRVDVLQGWYSAKYGTRTAAPVVAYRWEEAAPSRTATLLYPFTGAAKPAVTLTVVPNGWRVEHPAGVDHITVDGDDLRITR